MKKDWEIKTLGEVCEVLDNLRKPIKKSERIEGMYPYYGATGILSYVNSYIFSEKLVLIGEDGAKWDAGDKTSFISEGLFWVNNHAHVIRTKRDIVLDEWIVQYLNYSDLTPFITGMTVPKLNQEKMKSIPIPIPPIKEQEEIVEKLDKGFELIDSLKETAKKNLDNAKELFQSVLREELSPKDGWETKTLGEAGTTLTGQTPPTKDKDNFGNYIPFVKPADFFNGELNYLNEGLSEKGMKYSRVSKKGSTLMVCIGATIGKTAFTEIDVTSNQQINSIYPSKDFFPKFIYYYLISKDFYNQVIENASQATLPIINKSKWESLTISFPKSIKEQEEIVNRLDRIKGYCEELEGNYNRVLELCEELKQGLLREAFSY